MRKLRRFGGAFAIAAMVAGGVLTTSTPAFAKKPGYCAKLAQAIQYAHNAGLTDLEAYLQSLYDEYCS